MAEVRNSRIGWRAQFMLALALIPIFSALIAALVYRASEQQEAQALVPQREAVDISWTMAGFTDDFLTAVLAIQEAGLERGRPERMAEA